MRMSMPPAATVRTSAPADLSLRPITEADLEFLAEVYASTRREELALVPWSQEEKEQFLRSQFELQHQHYQQHYPTGEFLVIEKEVEGRRERIGRLYVDRWEDQIRIVEVALLPPYRGSGLGARLIGGILAEAKAQGLPVTIHVEGQNPARRLYQRLGFEPVQHNGIYQLMRWSP